jgi:L-seryl-tRNA(Ser) seleniumtransferase
MRPPSVDRLARTLAEDPRFSKLGHSLLVDAAREGIRLDPEHPEDAARSQALAQVNTLMRSVVNATGVLLHTNLGRSPLPAPSTSTGVGASNPIRYSNVEFDLDSGSRGSRRQRIEPLLAQLCGAESALIVNNCAAALVLVLAALARSRGVAVSRGELVEIGGGFRIPEVLEQSGARLVEVGTTNRTRLRDYESAVANVNNDVGMLLKVHTSNYRISGFTEETDVQDLVGLGVTTVADIGSGLLDSRTPWLASPSGQIPPTPWLHGEPAVRQTLEAGAHLVVFSCDKLLGGPQGGAIVGSKALVDVCAKHPLARALRPGSLVISALQETLLAYDRRDLNALPFWRMATIPVDALRGRADAIVAAVGEPWCEGVACASVPGGGTLPEVSFASYGISLSGSRQRSLRGFDTPIIARTLNGRTLLDLRTVDPLDDALLIDAIRTSSTEKATKSAGVASPAVFTDSGDDDRSDDDRGDE